MISRRLLGAALETLGPKGGRNWDFLGGLFHAGTASGVDAICFTLHGQTLEIFEPEEDDLFLIKDAVMTAREGMFEEFGAPRFRHCLALIRGVDEKSVVHYSYADTPEWPDVMDQNADIQERFAQAFSWQKPAIQQP